MRGPLRPGDAAGVEQHAQPIVLESVMAMPATLADRDYVDIWVDGVHFNVRLEETRLCCLVIVGVRLDGSKELVAITDGYRESTDSWADLRRRGMQTPLRSRVFGRK
jgi:transposase-like protein